MNDSRRLAIGLILFAAIFSAGMILIIEGMITSLAFYILIALSLIVLALSFFAMKGEWVSFDGETVSIKAPFTELKIPKDSIQNISLEKDFKMGLRVFGYGGLTRGSGNFSNSTLGDYTLAGNTKCSMIVVRYKEKGKDRIAAFNLPGENATLELYGRLASDDIPSGPVSTDASDTYRKKRKNLAIAVVAILAISICITAVTMSVGSATAHIEDDELIIDGTMFHRSIALEDIDSVELRDDIHYGARVAGVGNSKVLTGHFRNSEFGDYNLCVNKSVTNSIIVHTDDGIFIFNLQSGEKTADMYEQLSELLKDGSGGNTGA